LASCCERDGRETYTAVPGGQHSNVQRPGFRQRWHTGLPPPPPWPGPPRPKPSPCDGMRCKHHARERPAAVARSACAAHRAQRRLLSALRIQLRLASSALLPPACV
jgi:hypothetical protein